MDPDDPSFSFAAICCDPYAAFAYAPPTTILLPTTLPRPLLAYKLVAKKVRPVPGVTPEEFRIIRRFHPDPLDGMPELHPHPVPFTPTGRLTEERYRELNIDPDNFLWPEEHKLVVNLLMLQNQALAWDESERGCLSPSYFDPVLIPTIPHVPWVCRNIPVPPGLKTRVTALVRDKLNSGVLEPSNSSYRNRSFTVPKKNGDLRFILDAQELNRVTIRDASVPPDVDTLAESCAGRSIYSSLDLFVAFDQRQIDE